MSEDRRCATRALGAALSLLCLAACGGGLGTPDGPTVGSPGGPPRPPTRLVDVHVEVTLPATARARGVRPAYVSPNTQSLVIQLASVDGSAVTGVNATTIDTVRGARGCSQRATELVCRADASGAAGDDVFSVTTYAGTGATGAVLSVGTVTARIDAGGGTLPITNRLSLTLDGVIASLDLMVSPDEAKRGTPTTSAVTLRAFDASGALIVGPSDFSSPLALAIQGDGQRAFRLRAGAKSGAALSIVKPTSNITLHYDGDPQASTISVQAAVDGPSVGASARFSLRGKQQPPPVGTIYALNLGKHDGRSATVTEYDGKANGNAAPARTLQLSAKLFARSIAVGPDGKLYVGFLDNQFGFSPTSGKPDLRNVVAIYASGASGNAQPIATLQADPKTNTTIFPILVAFDPSGDLVTYGATSVDGNVGDAVLTYSPGSSGAAPPAHGWNFASPTIDYAGPTGLALDSAGNFYVNGALHATLGPSYGIFIAPASDVGNPQSVPARTVPWDATTGLTPGRTGGVALDASGEIFVANSLVDGGAGTCQGQTNVFAAGANGGVTDVPPLRVLSLGGVVTKNPDCDSPRSPLAPFFPAIDLFGTTLFVADDFNDAISAYPADARGAVKPSLTISGTATQLDAPIAVVATSLSGRAKARSVNFPFYALDAQ